MTPGQAAYEAWNGGAPNAEHSRICWENDPAMCPRWEAAAKAVIEAFVQQPAPLVVRIGETGDADVAVDGISLLAERDSLTGRIAELVTEGNELRGLLAKVDAALLEGGQDHASKARKAIRLISRSGLLHRAYEDASLGGEPPAVTAGTEHLAAQLAAVTANRDAWCERAGELLTETRKD